ncbi:DinB family protein [Virgibacillus halophilus]|uniref:DinB family protein n=1 Tax=Tigheibacillus halophilus TaxID=361280 RepID=A0ABU5C7F8_9BACI|nr:DinB family protein [Virgibacillus halophilus]
MENKITKLEGYSPQISNLVSMMNYVRKTTLETVAGLSVANLDFLPSGDGNSIGALLAHIAAVERFFQIQTFEERHPHKSEIATLTPALGLGELGRDEIRGRQLSEYLQTMASTRENTLQELKKRDDEWLFREAAWGTDLSNNYFLWFHVFEDEINHRGQMRIIRKMMKDDREE